MNNLKYLQDNIKIGMDTTELVFIDLSKKYKTRGGREVKLFHIFKEDEVEEQDTRVHGAVLEVEGWEADQWYVNGRFTEAEKHSLDLIEIA